MSSFKSREIRSALPRKGFSAHHTDHERFRFQADGLNVPIKPFLSHGAMDYGDSLLGPLAQMKLSKAELGRFRDCRMDGDEYLEILRRKGVL